MTNDPCFSFNTFNYHLTSNHFIWLSKIVLLVITFFALLLLYPYVKINHKNIPYETFILILFVVLGSMILIGAGDFLTFYLAFELQSFAFYILIAMGRGTLRSLEAALKYFILGSFSTTIFLLGVSLLYGITGATHFNDLRRPC